MKLNVMYVEFNEGESVDRPRKMETETKGCRIKEDEKQLI